MPKPLVVDKPIGRHLLLHFAAKLRMRLVDFVIHRVEPWRFGREPSGAPACWNDGVQSSGFRAEFFADLRVLGDKYDSKPGYFFSMFQRLGLPGVVVRRHGIGVVVDDRKVVTDRVSVALRKFDRVLHPTSCGMDVLRSGVSRPCQSVSHVVGRPPDNASIAVGCFSRCISTVTVPFGSARR
ncbi:hypothetical protein A7U43_21735 [Mycobacterium adipatum]|uniref:Uncharacterized protein n=1 Tax=Mycobacterium adipatum TaxID=1682113 RepID=A0A172UQV6_9MYCO|nr:hypothetical protein A7U43_21735 [Mycobacterium adipatum]